MVYTLSSILQDLENTNESIMDCISYADKMKDTISYRVSEKEIVENVIEDNKIRTGNFTYLNEILQTIVQDIGLLHTILNDLSNPSVMLPDLDIMIAKYGKRVDEIKSNFISYNYKLDMFFNATNYDVSCDLNEVQEYLEVIKEANDTMVGVASKYNYLDRQPHDTFSDESLNDAVIDYLIGKGISVETVEDVKLQVLNTIKDIYSSIQVLLNPNNTDVLSSSRLYEKFHRALDVVNQNLSVIDNN